METKDIEMTKELKEKLKGFMAIDISAEFKYVPIAYREIDEKYRAVFTLKSIDGITMTRIQDGIFDDAGKVNLQKLTEAKITVCKAGVLSWENFRDYMGRVVAFDPEMKSLPPMLITELFTAINDSATIQPEEEQGL